MITGIDLKEARDGDHGECAEWRNQFDSDRFHDALNFEVLCVTWCLG